MRIELRKIPRTSTRSTIHYQPAGNGSAWEEGLLLDMSPHGAALRLPQPRRLHETLQLRTDPAADAPRTGVVRWVRKDGEAYQVGIEFL